MVLNIRNIAAIAYSYFLIFSGKIKRVKKMAAKGEIILSVYFHNPKKELFNNCVKWFLKNGFHFISVDELNIIIENNDPFPPSSVVFTVDDGWKENKENIISVVDKYKIPLTIFITTSPVETGEAYWWSYALKANQQGIISNSVENLKRVSNLNRLSIIENVKSKIYGSSPLDPTGPIMLGNLILNR